MSLVPQKRLKTAETQLGISGADTFVGDKVFTGVIKFSREAIAAAGSAASDAAALTKQVNLVTGADGAKGVALPAAAAGISIYIVNTSATANLLVYPVNGGNDNINSLAEDLPYSMSPGQESWFIASSATQWYVEAPKTKVARQSADVTATTSTTLANLTGLVHTVNVGTYRYRAHLQCLSTANGGTKVGFKFTNTTLTSIQNNSRAFTATGVACARTTTATDQASLQASTAANTQIALEGTIVVSAAGTIQLQGAQNASHADTTTFYTGSTFELTQVA